jgi:hypothetical protein
MRFDRTLLAIVAILPALLIPSGRAVAAETEAKKIVPSTKQEDEAAIVQYHKWGDEAGAKLKIEFHTIETPHFLVFTDWDPREYDFLKENVENAYAAVSKQFDRSTKDNVFVGKLPIFMITANKDFMRFAKELSHMTAPPKGLAGYYTGRTDGLVTW